MFSTVCKISLFLIFSSESSFGKKRFLYLKDGDLAEAVHQLITEVKQLKKENEDLKNNYKELLSKGATYVHWGRGDCPGNGSDLVYRGYIGGSKYNQHGGGASNLCLPDEPTWANYSDTLDEVRGRVYGSEFELGGDDSQHFLAYTNHNQDIPCALCRSVRHPVMIPGRANCYPGWTTEYSGYLMSQYYNYPSNGDFICVDGQPSFVGNSNQNDDDHLLYLVEGRCGSLPCPPYVDGRELACIVCSI